MLFQSHTTQPTPAATTDYRDGQNDSSPKVKQKQSQCPPPPQFEKKKNTCQIHFSQRWFLSLYVVPITLVMLIFLTSLVWIHYLILGVCVGHDWRLSPLYDWVSQVYGRDLDTAAPYSSHYCLECDSEWRHQSKMAALLSSGFGLHFLTGEGDRLHLLQVVWHWYGGKCWGIID